MIISKHDIVAKGEFPRLISNSDVPLYERFQEEIKKLQDDISHLVYNSEGYAVPEEQQEEFPPEQDYNGFANVANARKGTSSKHRCPEFNHCTQQNHHTHDDNYEALNVEKIVSCLMVKVPPSMSSIEIWLFFAFLPRSAMPYNF